MNTPSSTIVQRLWNYCNVLRDDGMSYGDYVEQLTYLLFLKMDAENASMLGRKSAIPEGCNWASLQRLDDDDLEIHYRTILTGVECFHAGNRFERTQAWSSENETGRWRSFPYEELLARDKVNLDIFWLRDESLEDSAHLPDPDVLAAEIVEELQAALDAFTDIAEELGETKTQADRAISRV